MVAKEERPSSRVSPEHSMSDTDMLFDYQASVADSTLALSPDPANQSLTFVTPSSSIFTTPQSSPPKATAYDVFFPGTEPEHDETACEEKPPREEKHVTSTPYLGVGSLRDSIGKRFDAQSRLGTWPGAVTPGASFMEEIGMALVRVCM